MKKQFLTIFFKQILNRIFNPFFDINIKPMELKLNPDDKCLVIAPHPDDESIGCGGILKLHPKQFDVISLTHGNKDDIRYEEMHNAMNYAGVKNLTMLELKDKHITDGQKEFNEIDIEKYNYIFIPYIFDQHKDHKAVSMLLLNKLKDKKYKSDLKIGFYEVWSTINMPQYFTDISKVVQDKKNMINFHKSQVASKEYADKIIGLNSYRGLLKSLDAVESYLIVDVKDFKKIVSRLIYDI